MNIRHRVSDIRDLQVHVLQDYFCLGVRYAFPKGNWKPTFIDIVEYNSNKKYAPRYLGAWKKILSQGEDNYDITDMDTTIIVAMHNHNKQFMFLPNVRFILDSLNCDRNEAGHSDANESINKLLGWSYSALKNLERLLTEVESSKTICKGVPFDEKDRKSFAGKYKDQIAMHSEGLKNDHQEAIAEDAMINHDINFLKSRKGNFSAWKKIYPKYFMPPLDVLLHFKFLSKAANEKIEWSFSPLAEIYYDELDLNEEMGIPVDYEEAAKLFLQDKIISGKENDFQTDIKLASIFINGLSKSHNPDEGEYLLNKCRDWYKGSGRSRVEPYIKKSGLTFYRIVPLRGK